MRVRRCAGREPAVGVMGTILTLGTPTTVMRVGRLPRTPAIATRIDNLVSVDPVMVRLDPPPSSTIRSGRLYLHLLRASFNVERTVDGFQLSEPENGSPGADAWSRWLSLPDPAVAISESPALLYPPHHISTTITVPSGFLEGTLILYITAGRWRYLHKQSSRFHFKSWSCESQGKRKHRQRRLWLRSGVARCRRHLRQVRSIPRCVSGQRRPRIMRNRLYSMYPGPLCPEQHGMKSGGPLRVRS